MGKRGGWFHQLHVDKHAILYQAFLQNSQNFQDDEKFPISLGEKHL